MTQPATSIPAAAAAATQAPAAPAVQKRQVGSPYQSKASGLPASPPAQAQRSQMASRAQRAQEAANKAAGAQAPAAPSAPPKSAASQSAAVTPPVAERSATEGTSPTADSGAAKPGEAAKPAEAPAVDGAAGTEQAKLAEGEYARRMASLTREDARISTAKQELARQQEQHREALQRANMVEQIRTKPPASKLQFLQQVFGWNVQSILDEIVTDGTRTPEQKVAQAQQLSEQRMAAIEREVQQAAQERQQSRNAEQVRSYISGSINPIIDSAPEFKILRDAFGDDAGRQVYSVLADRFSKTQRVGDPKDVCKEVANYLRSEAEKSARLLGGASAPAAGQAPKQDRATSQQAAPAPPTTGFAKRMRAHVQPYKSKPLA
jgi:hypothetical protein